MSEKVRRPSWQAFAGVAFGAGGTVAGGVLAQAAVNISRIPPPDPLATNFLDGTVRAYAAAAAIAFMLAATAVSLSWRPIKEVVQDRRFMLL